MPAHALNAVGLSWLLVALLGGCGGAGPGGAAAECPARRCLVIEPVSTYCSVDPVAFQDGLALASKSRLSVRAGVYPLVGREKLAGLTLTLETDRGQVELRPEGEVSVDASREGLDVVAAFRGEGLRASRVLLRTDTRVDRRFLFGDPEDVQGFYDGGRNLLIRLDGTSRLLPGLVDATILYAPCAMRGRPDDLFIFDFADGSKLELTVRSVSGPRGVGYYMGRLLAAEGVVDGEAVGVRDRRRLAFIGSTRSWSEMAIPSFVVATGEAGERCGLVLDSSRWDTEVAVNGYVAHRLSCDHRRGAALALRAVSWPDRYQLP